MASPDSVTRSPASGDRLRDLARLLDEAIRIPGTNIRVGLDALLGLLPGGGDVAGGLLSGLIMLQAARAGAPASILARMLGNVLLDVAVGTVPLLGDLFDVAWRANTRNVRLLDAWRERPVATRRASGLAVGVILVALLVVIALAVWGSIALVGALFDLLKTT